MNAKIAPMRPALPRPDYGANSPDPEDFAAWCEHPVTRFVAAAMARAAERQRDEWTRQSWGQGACDPIELNTLRTRADAYMAFLETGLREYVGLIES